MRATSKAQRRVHDSKLPLGALGDSAAVRLSVAERKAAGKALRAKVPRRGHGEYSPAPGRRDPVAILEGQAKSRVQHLVPIRYGRMLGSPFAFLRGSAAVMAADLAPTPTTDLMVQACGDAHVSNFGVFASAERNLIYAINDFDETHPAPWEWDVKRLAASATVCVRFIGGAGRPRRGQSVPRADAGVRGYGPPPSVVLADRGAGGSRDAFPEGPTARRKDHRQGTIAHQSAGARQADRSRRRSPSDPREQAADRPRDEDAQGGPDRGRSHALHPELPGVNL